MKHDDDATRTTRETADKPRGCCCSGGTGGQNDTAKQAEAGSAPETAPKKTGGSCCGGS